MRRIPLSIALSLLGALSACNAATLSEDALPEYALPTVQVVDAAQVAKLGGIPYRPLTRDDFRATAPPMANAEHAARMSAFTCANIVPLGDLEVEVRQERARAPFVAQTRAIQFVAKMDPRCSWWNPAQGGAPQEYILQHEQIHFAIVELAARDLTARVLDLEASGRSQKEAVAALQRDVDRVLVEVTDAMTARNTAFDVEVSGRYDTAAQQRWYDEVTAALARRR